MWASIKGYLSSDPTIFCLKDDPEGYYSRPGRVLMAQPGSFTGLFPGRASGR